MQVRHVAYGLFSGVVHRMANRLPPTERVTPKVKKRNGNSVMSNYLDYKTRAYIDPAPMKPAESGIEGSDPSGSSVRAVSHDEHFSPREPLNTTQQICEAL